MPGQIAVDIHDECAHLGETSWIRARRLALGISLADVVAQVRAWYISEGRAVPRFSETLLSAYESAQKRPGPEYLHYLCAVYRADPPDLGYPDSCFCGRGHSDEAGSGPAPVSPATAGPHAEYPGMADACPGEDDDVVRRMLLRPDSRSRGRRRRAVLRCGRPHPPAHG
jgi:transcriptional regulator with XRE-family HTH domain